jgi:hypothetical protein
VYVVTGTPAVIVPAGIVKLFVVDVKLATVEAEVLIFTV